MKLYARRVLITAGPTREYIDPVRFISNDSSGKMGFALAKAARLAGFHVTLISGPVSLETPSGVRRIDIISALEMRRALSRESKNADIIIMAAAVADFRPSQFAKKKIKRGIRLPPRVIRLKQNPDILAEICRLKKPHQKIIGFALETNDLQKNALAKLKSKGCDFIVANKASSIGKDLCSVTIFSANGTKTSLKNMPKKKIAKRTLELIS